MFATMCVTVFMRYVMHSDLNAIEEYLFFIAVWAVFLGAANGSFEKSHISADTVATLAKNRMVLRVNAFVQNTITLLLAAGFFYYSLMFVLGDFELPSYTTIHRLPYLIGHSGVFYGSLMMFVYTLFHYCEFVIKFLAKAPASVSEATAAPEEGERP